MWRDKLLEYDGQAVYYYQLRREAEDNGDEEVAEANKKMQLKFDKKAFDLIRKNGNLAELYDEMVSVENRRAIRSVRYHRLHLHKEVDLKEKERWAIELIKMALSRAEKPSVSCSFGIDSIVTLYLVRKSLVEMGRNPSDIQVVWCDTLNEFPEVRMFSKKIVEEWNLNLMVQKPKRALKHVIDKHGGVDSTYFFTRKGDRRNGMPLSEKCCGTLKHEPMRRAIKEGGWDLVMSGIRADESNLRFKSALKDGEYYYSNTEWKAFTLRPIIWFTNEDIWNYVFQEDIPYTPMYDNNIIQKYPADMSIIFENMDAFESVGLDVYDLIDQNVIGVNRKQAILIEKYGFKLFKPRVGCMMCPIPVKHGYLHFIRHYYPKVYKTMIYNLGYGKALLELVPQETKDELSFILGIDLNEENAHEYLKDILESKPCIFDKFD